MNTNEAGEYVITGLPAGEYAVEFGSDIGLGRYVTSEFYKQVLFLSFDSEAAKVPVTEGSTTAGIDAEMEEGGIVEGTVTSALSGKPLAGIEACAYDGDGPSLCAETNAAGEYEITRVASRNDQFTISFHDRTGRYAAQYYPGKSNEGEGQRLTVPLNSTTTGIDATMPTSLHDRRREGQLSQKGATRVPGRQEQPRASSKVPASS